MPDHVNSGLYCPDLVLPPLYIVALLVPSSLTGMFALCCDETVPRPPRDRLWGGSISEEHCDNGAALGGHEHVCGN